MAVKTAEGPLTQLGNKGYPSELRLVSERASQLEVWTKFKMFYVINIHCLSSGLCYCYFVEKVPLIIYYLEGKSDYLTLFITECKVDL